MLSRKLLSILFMLLLLITNITSANEDISYSIIKTDTLAHYKRSLVVRLNRRVTKDVLRSIALKLKNGDPKKYDRTFICYYLSGINKGSRWCWATTHFNPTLKVDIIGLTVGQIEVLLKNSNDLPKNILGSWLQESVYDLSNRVTIYSLNGKLFMRQRYVDGSSGDKEIVERKPRSRYGRRFQDKIFSHPSDWDVYYLIDQQGNLQTRDEEGLIFSIAVKIKR